MPLLEDIQNKNQQLLNNMRECWPPIADELKVRRATLGEKLISKNCEETRGRIKEIDTLLEFPNRLAAEISEISKAPEGGVDSEEGEYGIPGNDELIDQLRSYGPKQED